MEREATFARRFRHSAADAVANALQLRRGRQRGPSDTAPPPPPPPSPVRHKPGTGGRRDNGANKPSCFFWTPAGHCKARSRLAIADATGMRSANARQTGFAAQQGSARGPLSAARVGGSTAPGRTTARFVYLDAASRNFSRQDWSGPPDDHRRDDGLRGQKGRARKPYDKQGLIELIGRAVNA